MNFAQHVTSNFVQLYDFAIYCDYLLIFMITCDIISHVDNKLCYTYIITLLQQIVNRRSARKEGVNVMNTTWKRMLVKVLLRIISCVLASILGVALAYGINPLVLYGRLFERIAAAFTSCTDNLYRIFCG